MSWLKKSCPFYKATHYKLLEIQHKVQNFKVIKLGFDEKYINIRPPEKCGSGFPSFNFM